ncbi:MAG: adenylate kinase [Streptococcaceae bacterium]|jgi:adenylate kinase|nr:adenylate kinase [Streptococcaceae bacterium]
MNLLIMGLPGAGKGTQTQQIVATFNILQISTGDMFRSAMKKQTKLGLEAKAFIEKGELVSDKVTNEIVKERLSESDVNGGFLLDGFPRTIKQAKALDSMLVELQKKIDAVINIQVAPAILIERLAGRFICRDCGATYHKLNNPPKIEGVCDRCGEHNFYQRDDDKPETVKNRLDINMRQSQPILAYYEKQGLVHNIDGNRDIDLVFADVKTIIEKA